MSCVRIRPNLNRHAPNGPRPMSLTSVLAAVGTVADSATHRLQLDSGIQLLRSSPRMTVGMRINTIACRQANPG